MRNRTVHTQSRLAFLASPAALLLVAVAAALAPGWSGWQPVRAQVTDVATLPVFSSTVPSQQVKPNLMFIMDDSGSMDWTYMPDAAENFDRKYGNASNHCNGVYYNPAITYTPPVKADGTSFPDQSFTDAANDGYLVTGVATTNLGTDFRAGSETKGAAYYYKYTGTQTTERKKNYNDTASTFYKECASSIGNTPGKNVFTKVLVGDSEKTNFANWYSYYRTRMNMMKTATGLAFKSLDASFRVGFMSINNGTGSGDPAFLNVSDFDATQKGLFYSKLYGSKPDGGTPLREALAKAGRLYAGQIDKINGVTVLDPVQYSCQQNYTILSTDGMWNNDAGVQLDGTTAIGNQDGTLPRPYRDSTLATETVVTPYTSTQRRTTTLAASEVTRTWQRTTNTLGAACTTGTVPSSLATAPLDIRYRVAALYKGSDPDGASDDRCVRVEAGSDVWMCRTGFSEGLPGGGTASQTDQNGKTWYLVTDVTQSGLTCRSARNVFDNGDYSSTVGICAGSGYSGTSVTSVVETQTDTLTGYGASRVDLLEAVQTTTQTITDGVPGPVSALDPATPVYVDKGTVSVTETFGTQTLGAWTAGAATTNCVAAASLPPAGLSAPKVVNTVYSGDKTETTASPVQVTSQVKGTPTVTVTGVSGGVADTLADVAAYYYSTNLRTTTLGNCTGPIISPNTTPNDLCTPNTVPAGDVDTATWQHMTTFTVGLGVRGKMVFSPSYLTDTSGDFYDVLKGNTASSTNCTWITAGATCNWPAPSIGTWTWGGGGVDELGKIDDLWHAAVNGRGNYFGATDPGSLANGLRSTLQSIVNQPRPGTASAAATTNPRITSANNFQFSSYFKTVEWSGELIRQTMNLADGSVPYYDPFDPDPATYDWSAQSLLNAKLYTTRKIYTMGASGRIDFTWGTLSAAQKAYFTTPHITSSTPQFPNALDGLSQFCTTGTTCLSTADQTAAAGEPLVNFLRGDRSNEEVNATSPDNAKYYRYRRHVLGDIVSAQPQWIGPPERYYSDSGYAAFKTKWASRTSIVYAAANDGMLHAFNSTTGAEAWAYIPSFALPRMYTLADKNYANKHQYFVEGTPVSGDICPKAPASTCSDSEWRTILVGGLNAGGTGYYALDVTDPASPTVLWEFTEKNMGYTFGKPQITKLTDGTWVVILTSGYNNCPRADGAACTKDGTGDGQGMLYVLNAGTGALLTGSPIATGVGSTTNPSGLGQILAHADTNNVTRRVYAGDLHGNLWRFSVVPGSFGVHRLATLRDADGNVQPITVKPQVTTINGNPVVYVGTGRYLGASDVGGSPKNSFYAIKDDLSANNYFNDPRTYTSSFIGKQAVDTTCPAGTDVSVCRPGQVVRTVSAITGTATGSLQSADGWYVDFPAGAGEIEFTDPKLTLGTLAFSTSVPRSGSGEACTSKTSGSEGDALAYMLDYLTGGAVGTGSGVIATNIGVGVATAPQIAQLPNGTVIAKYRLSTGQEVGVQLRFSPGGGSTKRISWRELLSD